MADPETKNEDDEAWRLLFKRLVQNDAVCSIQISDLENAVKNIKSKELRSDYDLQDFQLKR